MYNNANDLLNDIIEAIEKIYTYTEGMNYEIFLADNKTVDAVIRNFEIIGEAATKLPEEFKDTNQQINWHRIKGMRNRMAHDYRNVNISIIWETIEMDLAELKEQIKLIL
ncbi:MAG: hypothetical protein RL708_2235 [Bacteroidota bacterium]|jgi:uncharacterized protein with HEPN domain